LEENLGIAKSSNQTSRAWSKHTSLKSVKQLFTLTVHTNANERKKSNNKKEKEERTDSFNCYTKMKMNSDYDPETIVKLTIELFIS